MSSVTFDGIQLRRPSFPEFDRSPITNETILVSGKRSVQSTPELGFKVTFRCWTTDRSDIIDLRAKIGSPYTLVVDGTSYTNCYINRWVETKIDDINWAYSVGFVRETT